MEILITARGKGKTTECIRRSAETGAVIVCADQERVRHVMLMAKKLRLKIPQPIFMGELASNSWRRKYEDREKVPSSFIFDDLQDCLEVLCEGPVALFTMNEQGNLIKVGNSWVHVNDEAAPYNVVKNEL